MTLDIDAFQKILGQLGVASFVGGLLDGVLSGGFTSTFILGSVGVLAIFFSIVRR
jgi:hypothetical protein